MRALAIRQRLSLWFTLVAALSLALSGLLAGSFGYYQQLSQLDSLLESEVDHFYSQFNEYGGASKFDWSEIDHEAREWLQFKNPERFISIQNGQATQWLSPNVDPAGLPPCPLGIGKFSYKGATLRYHVSERDGVRILIASSTQPVLAHLLAVGRGLLFGLPFALGVAWLGSRKLGRLAVAPVNAMTLTLEEVRAEKLDCRVPIPPVADEMQRHALVLNNTLERLEASYQHALRFSADASHELKTPLTLLRFGIENLLASLTLTGTDRATVRELLGQTQNLTSITSTLFLMSMVDAGCLRLELQTQDLVPLTEACVEDARIMAEPHGIAISSKVPAQALAAVDRLRFCQILSNLLENAIKYNGSQGQIHLELSRSEQAWVCSVQNTGPSISSADIPNLFKRFFRGQQLAGHTVPGSGLGLSLCRELAKAHGGDVWLASSKVGTTEFRVSIPL